MVPDDDTGTPRISTTLAAGGVSSEFSSLSHIVRLITSPAAITAVEGPRCLASQPSWAKPPVAGQPDTASRLFLLTETT